MMKRTLAITAAAALTLSLAGCSADLSVGGADAYRTRGAETVTATDTMYNGSTPGTNGTGMNAGAHAGSDTGMFDVTGTDGESGSAGGANTGTGLGTGSVAGAVSRARGGSSEGSVYRPANNGAYTATNNGGLTAQDKREAENRYQLMLENGRVHDTDGYLFDGENAHYRTF